MNHTYVISVRNVVRLRDDEYDMQLVSTLPEGATLWVSQVTNPQGYRWTVETIGNIQYCNIRLKQDRDGDEQSVSVSIQRPDDDIHDVYVVGSLRLRGNELSVYSWIFKWNMPDEMELLEKDRYGHAVYRMPSK